jgi:nicotinate-nucleotide adenylyltransferase
MSRRVGLFFGSFNPIHVGHLIVANTIIEFEAIDEVWFVVSPQNPFKKQSALAHEFDRIDMVEAAIADHFKMKASDVEFQMPKPSYTADTLAYLIDKHPEIDFKLIIGEDNLSHFPKWKNHEFILNQFGLIVYPRPNAKPSELTKHKNVKFIKAPMMDISATFIRDNIKNDRSVKYLLTDGVIEIINAKNLYR